MSLATAFIGLGSNLGDRIQNIRSAVRLLEAGGAVICQVSPAYENRAIGMGEAAGLSCCGGAGGGLIRCIAASLFSD